MNLDATDIAVVGGGGTAGLTFMLGIVQRYVSPRLEAQRDRIISVEAEVKALDVKLDGLSKDIERSRSKSQEFTSFKIAEVHSKFEALLAKQGEDLSAIRAALAEIKGEMKARNS